jgi:hypothetical protein
MLKFATKNEVKIKIYELDEKKNEAPHDFLPVKIRLMIK